MTLISNYFDPLTDGGIGCASKTFNSKQQAAILDQTKSVAEAGLQLVALAKVMSRMMLVIASRSKYSSLGKKYSLSVVIVMKTNSYSACGRIIGNWCFR